MLTVPTTPTPPAAAMLAASLAARSKTTIPRWPRPSISADEGDVFFTVGFPLRERWGMASVTILIKPWLLSRSWHNHNPTGVLRCTQADKAAIAHAPPEHTVVHL